MLDSQARPLVSVIMAVYRDKDYVGAAVRSILSQTLADLELVIVDDCGNDGSMDVVADFADSRIRVIRNERNSGLASSLNRAIAAARGRYLARMDPDDLSVPERLARQVTFMATHPDATAVSCHMERFGTEAGIWRMPLDPEAIRVRSLLDSCVNHAGSLLDADWLQANGIRYREGAGPGQDCLLWGDVHRAGGRIYNSPEVLLKYRRHGGNITASRLASDAIAVETARRLALAHEGLTFTAKESALLARPRFAEAVPPETIRAMRGLFKKLLTVRTSARAALIEGCALYFASMVSGRPGLLGKVSAAVDLWRVSPLLLGAWLRERLLGPA